MVRVRAVPAHDELHVGGESLVLVAGTVHRVSALGTLIRTCALDPVSLDELARALEEAFGAPAEGTTLEQTRVAVDTLLAAGLLEPADG